VDDLGAISDRGSLVTPSGVWRLLFAPLVLTWIALSGYYIVLSSAPALVFSGHLSAGVRSLWMECHVFRLPEGLTRGNSATASPVGIRLYRAPGRVCAQSVRCWRSSMEAPSDNAGSHWPTDSSRNGDVRGSCPTRVGSGSTVFPPGVILLIWLAGGLGKFSVYCDALLGIGVIGLAAYQRVYACPLLDHRRTPAGRIAAAPLAAES